MNYYTADLHWNHANVIRYSERPFADVGLMNSTILANINEVVGRGDQLYILGDVAFASIEDTIALLEQINCPNLHLIWGNHDPDVLRNHSIWKSSTPLKEIKDRTSDGKKHHVVLCHYAMRVWNRSHHGALQLYGHSHNSLPGTSQSLDVGVDCWDYRPVNLDQIVARMATLPPFSSGDHHR